MKILHVITSLATGGAEHLMVDLLPKLRDLGNDVEIAVFKSQYTDFYRQLESTGILIHGFSQSDGYYNYKHLFRLKKLISHFDIVHTHNTSCQFMAALAKSPPNILVTTEHSTSTRRRNYFFFRPIDRWMYKQYNQIICISEPSESSLRNYIGDNYPIITIKNGINVDRFEKANKIDLGLTGNKVVTMVAGFRYEKDQATLIRSLVNLPEEYHVVLVGDGEKRNEIVSLTKSLNLENRVHMLGVRNDVPQILKSSDVVVMSSHREGLSLSNVEGMASGVPFIASDVEGLREVTGGYGVLFPHGDDKALANEILKLTTDHSYSKEIVSKCLLRARQYDISKMAEEYNNIYTKLGRQV